MRSPSISLRAKGFTLIELMIVIGMFTMLLGLGLFISMDAYRGYNFRSEADTVVSVLQKARSRAMGNYTQSSWGVCYIPPNYILFRGTSCAVGVPTNETVGANPSIVLAGLYPPGVVFTQLSGTTTATTTSITQAGRTTTITINHEGTINW